MRRIVLFAATVLSSVAFASNAYRDTINFNMGWQFRMADAEQWQSVNVPHDFQISMPWVPPTAEEGEYKGDVASNVKSRLSARGFKEMGVGIYKKTFRPDPDWQGRRVLLDFQGIMYVGDVYLNGERIGGTEYGYVGFDIDVTHKLKFGTDNELMVKADTRKENNSRWYTGGGLFRDVNFIVTNKDYFFPRHPLYIRTSMDGTVKVQTEVTCNLKYPDLRVQLEIADANGKTVYSKLNVIPFNRKMKTYEYELDSLRLASPHLWSCETPYLYTAHVSLIDTLGNVVDNISERFGVRTVEFSPEFGMKLNGKKVLLKGIANHHTLGALGAAAYPRAIEKRIKLLKQFGYNHIRCSHNPYSEDFMRLCDENGIIVCDELYDKWLTQYSGGRTSWTSLWAYDVPEFVKRDRNHPCVVMWSLGNELQVYPELPFGDWGVTPFRMMKPVVLRYDNTRPVTVAMHPRGRNLKTDSIPADLVFETDIAAYNYRYMYFPGDGKRWPWMKFYQSEANTVGLPGNFFEPNRDKVIGSAYWGAIDYLGESGGWPAKGWAQGVFDISLEPKPIAYLMKSMFTDEPTVHIGIIKKLAKENIWNGINVGTAKMDENWNLPENSVVSLNTYTNAPEVELFVNGKSCGIKKNPADPKHHDVIKWDKIKYAPGYVEAVAMKDGKPIARHRIETTGNPVKLIVSADKQTWLADGKDVLYLRVIAVDSKGRRVPFASDKLRFSVEGGADIVGVANGDITSDESFVGTERSLYQGSAQVVLRSTQTPSKVVLSVSSDKYKTVKIKLNTK